jgi:hypothetical protein
MPIKNVNEFSKLLDNNTFLYNFKIFINFIIKKELFFFYNNKLSFNRLIIFLKIFIF